MKAAKFFLYCLCFMMSISAFAANDIKVTDNWVKATAPGQEVGAGYLTIQSKQALTLTSVETSAADSVEIHSMTMENGVMKMRSLESLDLPAGKPVKLTPGGFHLMLFDLKQALKAGEKVIFTLHFKDAAGKESKLEITSPIKANAE